MTVLTAGANVPLSSVQVQVSVRPGPGVEVAAVCVGEGRRGGAGDVVLAGGPAGPGWLSWSVLGAGECALQVDLGGAPAEVTRVAFALSLPDGEGTFAQRGPVAAAVSEPGGAVAATFETAVPGAVSSVVLLELYRRGQGWKVRALGQGYAAGRRAMLADHRVEAGQVASFTPAPVAGAPAPASPSGPGEGIRYERADRRPAPTSPSPDPAPVEPSTPSSPVSYHRADRASRPSAPAPQPVPATAPPPTSQVPAASSAPPPVAPERPAFDPFAAQPAAPAPAPAVGPQPLWDAVEQVPDGKELARPVRWDLGGLEATWVEGIRGLYPSREELPAGVSTFDVVQEWSRGLYQVQGSGFEEVWRGPGGRLLSPPWLTLSSVAYHPSSGRIVATGRLKHREMGMPDAHDLGAVNGANGFSWPEAGHRGGLIYPVGSLYVGSVRTGALVPVDAVTNHGSVDLDPVTGSIGVMEQLGQAGCISVYDGSTGRRRRLAVIDSVLGNEKLRFSPDGAWLLLSRHESSHLCEVATGRLVKLPVGECGWWPLADSMLLEMAKVDQRWVPRLFSLESGQVVHEFPAVSVPGEPAPEGAYVLRPEVSPDGREMLALTTAGVTQAHREEHGASGHLVRVDLAQGVGRLLTPALLPTPFPAERDMDEARWTAPFPYRPVRLGPALSAQLRPGVTEHEYLAPQRYADDAEAFLVTTLNHAIALFKEGHDVSYLMPEVIMAMTALRGDAARWAGQREWLGSLEGVVLRMAAGDDLNGRSMWGWLSFAFAFRGLDEEGRPAVSSLEAGWLLS